MRFRRRRFRRRFRMRMHPGRMSRFHRSGRRRGHMRRRRGRFHRRGGAQRLRIGFRM